MARPRRALRADAAQPADRTPSQGAAAVGTQHVDRRAARSRSGSPDRSHRAPPRADPPQAPQLSLKPVIIIARIVRMAPHGDPDPRHARERIASSPADEALRSGRRFELPRVQTIERRRSILEYIDDSAHEFHAVHRAARKRESRIGQQLQMRMRIGTGPSSFGASTTRYFRVCASVERARRRTRALVARRPQAPTPYPNRLHLRRDAGNNGSPVSTALPAGSWPQAVAASMSVTAVTSPRLRRREDLGRRVRHERRQVQRDDADGLQRVVDDGRQLVGSLLALRQVPRRRLLHVQVTRPASFCTATAAAVKSTSPRARSYSAYRSSDISRSGLASTSRRRMPAPPAPARRSTSSSC